MHDLWSGILNQIEIQAMLKAASALKTPTAHLLSYSKHRKLNQRVCHRSAELHASPHVRCPSAPVMLPHQSFHAASRKSTFYWCNAQDCGAAWTIGCHRAPAISTAIDSIKPLNLDTSLKNIFIFSVALSILSANGDWRELFTRLVWTDDSSNRTSL